METSNSHTKKSTRCMAELYFIVYRVNFFGISLSMLANEPRKWKSKGMANAMEFVMGIQPTTDMCTVIKTKI